MADRSRCKAAEVEGLSVSKRCADSVQRFCGVTSMFGFLPYSLVAVLGVPITVSKVFLLCSYFLLYLLTVYLALNLQAPRDWLLSLHG